MKNKQLVILMGGKATRLSPLSYSLPKGLLSIGQKPAIFNMITNYVKKGLEEIIFVVSPNNEDIIKNFVKKSFENLKITTVVQNNPQGPLEAFQLCKDYINKETILLLGDTLCETELDYSYDWLGYMNINDNSHSRWCLIKTDLDENIQEIIDKPNYTPETNKVLIGLYNFTNVQLLKEALSQSYERIRNEYQLSSLINYYCQFSTIKGLHIKSWQDTGTLKDYNDTLRDNISGRSFNKFSIDEYGVITKNSSYKKLKSEIKWLQKIQNSKLNFIIPQFISYVESEDSISYKTEFVPGKTVAEYYLYYDILESNWSYIFEKLLNFGKLMWDTKAPKKSYDIKQACYEMYVTKTLNRIADWKRQDILKNDVVYVNGEKLLGFNVVFDRLKDKIQDLINKSPKYFSIIHGDICFSNIIYLPEISSFKLLDPRGNFGIDTIYGDCRYDIAKFRHCYHGLYDYITHGLYKLKEKNTNEFEYSFLTGKIINPQIFDEKVRKAGYDVNEIEIIEGLLFISMIPLHSDDEDSQIMYYLEGLKCLNNQLN